MTEINDRIGSYDFMVEPFHADFTGRLTLAVLGNHLLNCASFHAKDRGFGIGTLNQQHYTWVLSRLVVEMEEMPSEYDKFTVETWVEAVYRLFTDRNYRIAAADGRTLGYARSVWAMIGMDDRKPVEMTKVNDGRIMDYVTDYPCPIDKPARIKLAAPRLATTHRVTYSDIDINGHVNSIRYIEHILDAFDISYFKDTAIKRFEIAYVTESYYGDTLDVWIEEAGDKAFNVEIKKNGGKSTVCRGHVSFG